MKGKIACGMAAVLLCGYALKAAAQTSGGSVRDRLIGTWMLVSTEERLKNGTTRPFKEVGPNGRGYLMYTADGHMCAALMRPGRPKWKNYEEPTREEKIAAIDGLVAYCGRFEVDEAKQAVYHYPEVAWSPNYLGTKQTRPYKFENGLLVFSSTETGDPQVESWNITWRKAK